MPINYLDKPFKRIWQTILLLFDVISSNKGSRFRQNFLRVAKANFLAQALTLIVSPLLTRLYSPTDFGTLVLFSSLLGFLLAFGTLRFDWSVPNAASRAEAAVLLGLGGIVLLCTSITTFVVLWFFGENFSFWNGFQVLKPFLLLLPVALVGGGLHQLMQSWFVREASLDAVSKAKIAQSLANTGLSISGGVIGLDALGLIVSRVVSAWIGIGTLLRNAYGLRAALSEVTFKQIKQVAFKFWQESFLSSLVSVVNQASLTVTPLLFAQYYSATEVGWYALMLRLAITPVGVFTGAIAQSFWAEAAILIKTDRRKLRRLYLSSSGYLAISAIPLVIICLFGPLYVGLIFGEEWAASGYILAALTPLVFGQIVVSPLSHLIVHRKQHWQLIWDVCRFILIFSLLVTLGKNQANIILSVIVIAIANLIMYVIIFLMNLKCLS